MKDSTSKPFPGRLGEFKRRPVDLSNGELVRTERLSDQSLPLVIRPAAEGLDAIAWATGQRQFVQEKLFLHGGLLLRDFGLRTVEAFEQFAKAVLGDLQEYRERSSPRNQVVGKVYTSTEYAADQRIFLHNENSYQQTFPLKISFFCDTPAARGGDTPIADVRKVYQRISPSIRDKFIKKKVMYVRNFGEGFGLPWQTVFQTQEKEEVEKYCRQAGIELEWKANNGLRTRQIRPAVAQHPGTGDTVWFNHATFFHVSTLSPEMREALLGEFKEEDLPSNTYYGDGTPIESSTLDELRDAYEKETVCFPWQKGDLLMLENMLVAHGRSPFEGQRKIVVAMAQPHRLEAAC